MLRPQTQYFARVKALNQSSESAYSNTISITTLPSSLVNPPSISPLTPILYKSITYKQYALLYIETPIEETQVSEYKISLSLVSDFSSNIFSNITYPLNTLNSEMIQGVKYLVIPFTALTPDTVYYARIQGSNSVGLSSTLQTSFTTDKLLDKPKLLGVSTLSAINATLNWTSVPSAVSYRLDVATDSGFTNIVINNLTVNSTSHLVTALIEQTTYYYRVRAYDGTNISSNSSVSSFTTLNGTNTYSGQAFNLNQPVITNNREVLTSSITVRWLPVENASLYSIDIATSQTFSTILSTIQTSVTEANFSSLTPGTLYFIRIKASHFGVDSPFTTTSVTTLNTDNSAISPTLLPVAINYSRKAAISWIRRSYASNYYLEISTISNFSTILQAFYLRDVDTYEITNLTPNTTYYARIYGLNNSVISPASAYITFNTNSALPVISGLQSTATESTINLKWNTASSYVKYYISVFLDTNDVLTFLHPSLYNRREIGNVSSFTVDLLLKPATNYKWQLEGETEDGDIYISPLQSISTLEKSPILQLNSVSSELQWAGSINKITAAFDSEFKNCVPGWIDRNIDSYNINKKSYSIKQLLNTYPSLYIKGRYFTNNLASSYTSYIDTNSKSPIVCDTRISNNSIALKWKTFFNTQYGIRVENETSPNVYNPFREYKGIKDIGYTSEVLLSNLTANTNYRIYLYFKENSKFIYSGTYLQLKTNAYSNAFVNNVGAGNNAPLISISNIEHDRLLVNTVNNDTNHITVIRVRRNSNVISIDKYVEISSGDVLTEIELESNTAYIIEAISVNKTTNQRSNLSSANTATLSVNYSPSLLTSNPVLSNLVILNQNEVRLNYTDINNATGYRLELSKSNTFSVLDYDASIYFYPSYLLITGLLATSVYYARLLAFNEYDITSYSPTVIIDTTP